jgi:hypothetical protein
MSNGKVDIIIPTRDTVREVFILRPAKVAPAGRADTRRTGRTARSYAAAGAPIPDLDLPSTYVILRGNYVGAIVAMGPTEPPPYSSSAARQRWIDENRVNTNAWMANLHEGVYERLLPKFGPRSFDSLQATGSAISGDDIGRFSLPDLVIGARANEAQWLVVDGKTLKLELVKTGARDLTGVWEAIRAGTGFIATPPGTGTPAGGGLYSLNFRPALERVTEYSTNRNTGDKTPFAWRGNGETAVSVVAEVQPNTFAEGGLRIRSGTYTEVMAQDGARLVRAGDDQQTVGVAGPALLVVRRVQPDATIVVNGQSVQPFRAGDNLSVLVPPGQSTVRVDNGGEYEVFRIDAAPGSQLAINAPQAAVARPPAQEFVVLGAPQGSRVTANGAEVQPLGQNSAVLRFAAPADTFAVIVAAPGGESRSAFGSRGAILQWSSMTPTGVPGDAPPIVMPTLSTGAVRITNAPEGTTVTVDGAPNAKGGAAPMGGTVDYLGIAPGSRTVVATSPDGESRSAQVAVTAGGTASLKWDRMAVASAPGTGSGPVYGVVRVSGVPQGAILTIEGSTSPAFTSGGTTTFPDVVAGARLITAELPDGSQRSMRVNVTRDGLTLAFDSLVQSREPRAVPPGTVRISGLPEGAQVTVNGGAPAGASRSGGEYTAQLPPGEHRVLVELANGELRSATVTVASNGSTAVAFDAMRQERPATQQPPTSGTATVNITHVGSRGPSSRPVLSLASDPNTPIPLSTSTTGPGSLTYSATVPLGSYIVVPGCREDAQGRLIPQRTVSVETPGMTYTVTFNCDNGGAPEGQEEAEATPPSMEGDIAPDPALPPNRGRLRVLRSPLENGPLTVQRIDQQPPPAYITMPAVPGVPGAFESILEPGMYLVTSGRPRVGRQPEPDTRVANVSGGFTSTVRLAGASSAQANLNTTGDKAPTVTTTMLTDAPRGMGRIRLVMPFVNAPTPFAESVAQGPGMPAQRITMRRIGTTADLPAATRPTSAADAIRTLIAPGGTVIVPDDVFEVDVAPGAYTVHSNAPGVALAGVTVQAGELVTVTIPRSAIGAGPSMPVGPLVPVPGTVVTGYAPTDAAAAAASGFRPGVKLPVGVTGRTAEGFRSGPIAVDLANAGIIGTVAVEFAEVRPGIRAWYEPGVGMVAGRVTALDLAGLRRLWTPILPAGFDGYGMER